MAPSSGRLDQLDQLVQATERDPRARQRLGEADAAFAQREYKDADRLASHALLEAQLAQYRSRAATQREEVRRRSEENARLRRELLGQGGAP